MSSRRNKEWRQQRVGLKARYIAGFPPWSPFSEGLRVLHKHTGLCPWNGTWQSQPCVEQGMVWWAGKQLRLQLIGGQRVLCKMFAWGHKMVRFCKGKPSSWTWLRLFGSWLHRPCSALESRAHGASRVNLSYSITIFLNWKWTPEPSLLLESLQPSLQHAGRFFPPHHLGKPSPHKGRAVTFPQQPFDSTLERKPPPKSHIDWAASSSPCHDPEPCSGPHGGAQRSCWFFNI